jgi:hypothetical protein
MVFCEHGNEPSGSVEVEGSLDHLSDALYFMESVLAVKRADWMDSSGQSYLPDVTGINPFHYA